MNKNFLLKINQILLNEKDHLLARSRSLDIDNDGDETDEIQANLITSIASQLSTRDSLKIHQIDNALRKIGEGSYGICEDCEENISEKRLEINPHFTMCISCAEQKEFEDRKKRF